MPINKVNVLLTPGHLVCWTNSGIPRAETDPVAPLRVLISTAWVAGLEAGTVGEVIGAMVAVCPIEDGGILR